MRPNVQILIVSTIALSMTFAETREAKAQAFGVELHNTMMPVSGAMGGASLARPQDVQSAINGNPASLARYQGTNFGFSGAWVEPTFNLKHTPPPGGILPGIVSEFNGKSSAQGSLLGNIAVTQDLRPMGIPGTFGIGLISSAGLGSSFRQIPESNGTSAFIAFLDINVAAGVEITDQLSAGAMLKLGNGTLDGPFVGLTGAAYDYALRGSLGLNYDVSPATTIGFTYQTGQSYNFDDAAIVSLPFVDPIILDIDVDLPDNFGIGVANESLMGGRLLLAADVLFKQWSNADLFKAVYDDQWVFQFGVQYSLNDRIKLRLGYVYAENATKGTVGDSAGGVTPPGEQAHIRYVQAQFPAFNRHRISGGVGIKDIIPNVDMDLFAGGMFRESQNFGDFTTDTLASYWIGTGMTWHFGGGCSSQPCDAYAR
jgi:long-chain fatty acid transport protein